MNIQEYLQNFYRGTKEVSLDGIRFLMEEFNHPEKKLKVIHIAGTNGKGSCTEMMANILTKAGYKVGKYISPHLINYNERISIGSKNITDEEIEDLIKRIESKVDEYNNIKSKKITYFELLTTMAFIYFYENNCDFVVLETGLGGLYDCTNLVEPIVSIITSVGYDHMRILGNTLEEIAEQKAGIIKQNSETIFVLQDEQEVNEIIQKTALNKNNILHLINKTDISNYSYNIDFQKFDYKNYKDILINLKGIKQIYNASICIECTDILINKSYNISEEALREGLKTVVHKARFETVNNNPLIIFDGAHNKPAIDNFINSVQMYYKSNKKVYIISILKTKDYDTIIKELVKDKDSIYIFTDGNNKTRYVPKEELFETAKKYTLSNNLYTYDLEGAIKLSKEKYKDYVIFIVGSFYIYGTVIHFLHM